MERVNIKETNLKFLNQLPERDSTNMLVIHHTGNENGVDTDPSAREIHNWHINAGYSGIGYHFVVRKNGVTERGRPLWALARTLTAKTGIRSVFIYWELSTASTFRQVIRLNRRLC